MSEAFKCRQTPVLPALRRWERSDKAEASTRPSKEEEEMRQKQLESYCGR
jgi:hypothetical protein